MKQLNDNSLRIHPAPQDRQVLMEPGVLHPTEGKVQVMNSMNSKDKSLSTFTEWAQHTCANHPETLKHMLKSSDVLDRVIAKRIMQIAGVVTL
ncbi:hypothetical protein [Methanosarcina sp. UBA411]|jgi:hypothetical protein|uniref:hypothetical protein n=1 Tax=Methanosarcina sp. UBA411 TaxID=1915589 RepID=UPI0025E25CE1|nr:hypothetical protein [Methanosarcina sp. UBA411]